VVDLRAVIDKEAWKKIPMRAKGRQKV